MCGAFGGLEKKSENFILLGFSFCWDLGGTLQVELTTLQLELTTQQLGFREKSTERKKVEYIDVVGVRVGRVEK